jgi:hypothetical protein
VTTLITGTLSDALPVGIGFADMQPSLVYRQLFGPIPLGSAEDYGMGHGLLTGYRFSEVQEIAVMAQQRRGQPRSRHRIKIRP